MTDQKKDSGPEQNAETMDPPQAENDAQAQAPENDNQQGQETPWAEGDAIDGTPGSEDPVALLVEESAKLKDQLQRTLADMENLRKRTAREVKEARAYAVSNFAKDMLGAGDNMRRALEAVPEEVRANADNNLKALLEGVELTEREMHKAFETHGVRQISPLNERFDPNFHQAMFEVPNPDVGNGTVIEVMQAGYVIGDRVLRPALVGVAKGGPKIPKVAPEEVGEVTPDAAAEPTAESAPKSETPDAEPQKAEEAKSEGQAKPGADSVGSRIDKSA